MPTPHPTDGSRSVPPDGAQSSPLRGHSSRPPADLVPFARRVTVAVLVTVLILTVAFVLWRATHVLLQAFAGVLFAVFLSALSDWLKRRTGMSYGWALAIVVIVLFALGAGLGVFLWNRLATQAEELIHKLPESFEHLRAFLAGYPWGRMLMEQVPTSPPNLNDVSEFTRTTGLIAGVADFLVTAVVVLFVGIFGAAEPRVYRSGLLYLVPQQHRPRAEEAIDAVTFNLRWWLVGQVVLMVIMGVTTTLGLMALGIPLALALGVIAGVLELIPYVGPWLSAVPALLMALLLGPAYVAEVAALYLGLHILEGYVLLPLIQQRVVKLPPALTLVMQVLLGEVLGTVGLFVAAPLTVTVVVLLKMLYVEDTLGDQAVEVPGEPGNAAHEPARASSTG